MNVEEIKNMSLEDLIALGSFECECGKTHPAGTPHVIIESGAINKLPDLIKECGAKKPFIVSGKATYEAAGQRVCAVLDQAGINYNKYVFPFSPVVPNETCVGSAIMHYDHSCDLIIGVGSGVINDISKILAATTGHTYIVCGTAPSMDGYASSTSSMDRDGLKISLNSKGAWAIVGDLDILCEAPMHMLQAGVGDMVAKYISICEWKIAHLLIGEYYCPVVAELVNVALKKVVDATPKLMSRDKEAVKAVMEGMVIAGLSMHYAGLSRPASGMEHYFSHIWDMRSLAFNAACDLHGIQCGLGTLLSLPVYDYIKEISIDKEKALNYVKNFDLAAWNKSLEEFVGEGAGAMIAGEVKEGKYNVEKHAKRLDLIIEKWDDIMAIVNEMPSYKEVYDTMKMIGAPVDPKEIGLSKEEVKTTFTMTKDIRDKYIATRLLWDLGLLEEAADKLF